MALPTSFVFPKGHLYRVTFLVEGEVRMTHVVVAQEGNIVAAIYLIDRSWPKAIITRIESVGPVEGDLVRAWVSKQADDTGHYKVEYGLKENPEPAPAVPPPTQQPVTTNTAAMTPITGLRYGPGEHWWVPHCSGDTRWVQCDRCATDSLWDHANKLFQCTGGMVKREYRHNYPNEDNKGRPTCKHCGLQMFSEGWDKEVCHTRVLDTHQWLENSYPPATVTYRKCRIHLSD